MALSFQLASKSDTFGLAGDHATDKMDGCLRVRGTLAHQQFGTGPGSRKRARQGTRKARRRRPGVNSSISITTVRLCAVITTTTRVIFRQGLPREIGCHLVWKSNSCGVARSRFGLQKRPQLCPEELERRLPPPPADCAHVLIGGHIVLVNRRTSVVLDIVHFEIR